MKKLTIIFLVVLVIFSVLIGLNLLYKPHKDIANSSSDFKINAKELYQNFTIDETAALSKFSNKVIESKGLITALDFENKNIVMDSLLFFQFDQSFDKNLKTNQKVKIKARLVGYDELMNEIKLDQSTLIP